jgi:hypothetical protein
VTLFLEFLYFLTGLSVLVALVALFRRRRAAARRFAGIGVAGVLICIALYQYLSATGGRPEASPSPAPATFASAPPTFERLLQHIEQCGEYWGECGVLIDRAQSLLAGNRVVHDSGAIGLRLLDGTMHTVSAPEAGPAALQFHAYLSEPGYYLIHVQYQQGDGYLLVNDRTGTTYQLDGLPVFSPLRDRFAVATGDLATQFNPAALSVWRIASDSVIREFEWRDAGYREGWYPRDPVWSNDSTIRVTQVAGEGEVGGSATLRRSGGRWLFNRRER